MFTVRDLMTRFGVSEETVLYWIKTGQLKALNVGQNPGAKRVTWRVTQAAVDAFEQSRTKSEPAPRTPRRQKPADAIQFYS